MTEHGITVSQTARGRAFSRHGERLVDVMVMAVTATQHDVQQWNVDRINDDVVAVHRAGCQPEPADWAQRLARYIELLPGVQVVGAKRVGQDATIFSMGEFVLHPKGFHHYGNGAPAEAFRFPEEVDAISGGGLVVLRDAFDAAGGVDALDGSLGCVSLSLGIRRGGGRCISVPDVVVVDDISPQPSLEQVQEFAEQWGFDWDCCDLDAARQRWTGTGLLWNVRLHGNAMPFEKYDVRPGMHWESYANVDVYRQRADHLVRLVMQYVRVDAGLVVDLGCGDGLFSHLLALQGFPVLGIDPEAAAIDQAQGHVARQSYPGPAPQFSTEDGSSLQLADGSVAAMVLFDVIEHLPNPIRVLREVRRVLTAGGALILSTPAWQLGAWSDPVYHVTEYSREELTRQITAAGLAIEQTGRIGGVYRDLLVVARRP